MDSDEYATTAFAFSLLGCAGISICYPWKVKTTFERVVVHLPLVLPVLFILENATMPARMNIRLDIPILLGAMGVAGLVYLIKLAFLFRDPKNEKDSQDES